MVTMMMYYRRRASPKHYNDMIEVEYGGRGHRTGLRNDHVDQLVCPRVPPAPVYKGESGRPAGPMGRAKGRGSPPPSGSRTPLGRAIERAGPPILHSFIYGGRGHPIDTQVDP